MCLGQRVGAFLLDRVLGGQDMERLAERAVLARDSHGFFLHRLQKGRLRARTGAVDFIGHQKLAKDRPLDKAKGAAAIGGGVEHFRTQNIGGH